MALIQIRDAERQHQKGGQTMPEAMDKTTQQKTYRIFVYNYSGTRPVCVDMVEWSGDPNEFDADEKTIRKWYKYVCQELYARPSELSMDRFISDLDFYIPLNNDAIRSRLAKKVEKDSAVES
jgi:carbonic anhydrase